jgi:hypothetical protein
VQYSSLSAFVTKQNKTTRTEAAAVAAKYDNFHEFSSDAPGPFRCAHISKLVSFNVPH